MKKLIFSIIVLFLLLVGSIFVLPVVLSSDTARVQFSKQISTLSGLQIVLDGPVKFSVFPDFGLVANNVKLQSSNGDFSVAIDKIVSGVKLAPLLSGNLEIIGLSLTRPEITINTAEAGQTSPSTNSELGNLNDPFATAVTWLEKLSLKRFEITNGKFISISADGSESTISNINTTLLAPSLDGEINIKFSALIDDQQISSTIKLEALRPILTRQPSQVNIALKMMPAPHPGLADLTISGKIQLTQDGSYQLSDGALASLGQPLKLDLTYKPGERPYINLAIKAQNVDFGLIERVSNARPPPTPKPDNESSASKTIDFGPLLEMDADIAIIIDRFSMDGANIRKINLQVNLRDGDLKINLGNAKIANGQISAKVIAKLGDPKPSVQGSVSASRLDIGSLSKLANAQIPLTGKVGLNIGYAFRGLDAKSIKDSFNLAGSASISNGVAIIPALGEFGTGPSAKRISALNVVAIIKNAQKPVDIKARMNWNGEAIRLNSLITPHNFIKNGSGPVTISFDSNKLVADYSGTVSTNGTINGRAKVTIKSLGNMLAWLGQKQNNDLKRFSYMGNVKLNNDKFEFTKARISLNGIQANGSGSISLKGKPSLNTDLAFQTLDIAALTGGTTATSNTKGSRSTDTKIDISGLTKFDANIKLSATNIRYGKVTAGPLKTTLVVKNGIAKFKLSKTPFYNGSIVANVTADGSKSIAAISAEAKLLGIDALPLFRDAAEFKRLEGKLNADLSIKGSGATSSQFAKSLAGNSKAQFADGAIRGINIAKIYNNLSAILSGGFKEDSREKTTFTELGLSFTIDKGIATTNDIKLQGPLVRMDGAGIVNLGEESINMRLNPRVVASAAGQGGDFDVKGLGIPLIINGPLSRPRVYPDLSEVLKNPQAALNSLSKLGLNIKGLKLKDLGKGKLDIAKLAKEKLNLEKLDKIAGKGTSKTVSKVIKGLLDNKEKPGDDSNNSGTEKVIGALLNQLTGSENTNTEPLEPEPTPLNTPPKEDIDLNITGNIPVPKQNPRRNASVAVKPKTTEEIAIEKIAPKIDLPVSKKAKEKGLKLLFDSILN